MGCTYTSPCFTSHVDVDSIKTVVDLGADIGDSSKAIHKFYNAATVYALECNPYILPFTRDNLKKHREYIHLIEKAIWDKTGKIIFRPVNPDKSIDKLTVNSSCFKWNPSLYKPVGKQNFNGIIQDEVMVESITIDDLCEEYHIEIDLLCMDIQGAELNAVKGAVRALKKIRYIITEVNYKPQYEGSCIYENLKEFLNDNGFVIKVENGTNIVDRVFENVLFVRKD